jgi:hypothetical protein
VLAQALLSVVRFLGLAITMLLSLIILFWIKPGAGSQPDLPVQGKRRFWRLPLSGCFPSVKSPGWIRPWYLEAGNHVKINFTRTA